ncbi:MAG: hypothetical protein LAO30_07420 [Acidobacteriia bacterium]|nr:hypothetical protein [Terriglobia bacterium]
MNRSFSARAKFAKNGNCRNPLSSSRGRREALAAGLDEEWRELRQHVTIEEDPEKILRLTAELDERRRREQVVIKRKDNR